MGVGERVSWFIEGIKRPNQPTVRDGNERERKGDETNFGVFWSSFFVCGNGDF